MTPRLSIQNLQISFLQEHSWKPMVDGVDLSIQPGEMLALVGESGCGKSLTAMSLLGLLPKELCRITNGSAVFNGEDLYQMPEQQLKKIRGNRIAMIFQEPMTALNPVFTIGNQLGEILATHKQLKGASLKQRCIELLTATGISNPTDCLKRYPFELSGGMRQRVMIAMSIACEPDLLIADEPTTALDVTIQSQIMALLRNLQQQYKTSVLFITHNLALASQYADRICVMYAGQIVESADIKELFQHPVHPYTRLLMQSIPHFDGRNSRLSAIAGMPPSSPTEMPGCRFAPRCPLAQDNCVQKIPQLQPLNPNHLTRCTSAFSAHNSENQNSLLPKSSLELSQSPILQVKNLIVKFKNFTAVNDISFDLMPGKTLAIVGESGCGKTTTGKAIIRLLDYIKGNIILDGKYDLAQMDLNDIIPLRRRIQMIFQDPFSSLNPRLTIGDSIAEGILLHKTQEPGKSLKETLHGLMRQVGLPEDSINRYPHQFSGGQRQRIGLARALAVRPEIIICDECTSALDVSIQAQIINLLKDIQQQTGISYIFITHDLGVVGYLAHEVCVMHNGKIVETGPTEAIYNSPKEEYTRHLLDAAPKFQ